MTTEFLTMEGIRELRRKHNKGKQMPEDLSGILATTRGMKSYFYEQTGLVKTRLEIQEIEHHVSYLCGYLAEHKKIENDFLVSRLKHKQGELHAERAEWEKDK